MDDTIIVRRPTTPEETLIGMELNTVINKINQLLMDLLETKYAEKDPVRFGALFKLLRTMLDAEADFFGFMSWEHLTKWQELHGNILGKIEL